MPVFRFLLFVLLLAALGCFGYYTVSGDKRYRYVGVRLVKWTVLAALAFFAVLIIERLIEGP
jgi:hypothetical protein